MDMLLNMPTPYMVLAACVVVSATLILGRLLANALPGKQPPILEGIPYIGGLLKFVKGPMSIMTEGYNQLGEVFTVPVAHKRITFLVGPEVAPHFFKATDDEMSQDEVYNFNVPTFGPGVIFDVERKIRTEQIKFFSEALKKERVMKYAPQFVAEAEDYISTWGNEGIVDLKEEFTKLITLTSARTLLGREVREQMFNSVSELLHDLDEGMMPISVMFPYMPHPLHWKRDRARKKLHEIFGAVIRARRASGVKEEDLLQNFIDAKYQKVNGGRALTETEISGLLIATLFAGQHTSSITTTWTGLRMYDNREVLEQVLDEQRRVIATHGTALTYEALQDMDVLHRSITEALRLNPPLILLLRYARTPFSVTTSGGKQFNIPKGDIVAASPNFSHLLPSVFENPTKFQPDRFAAAGEEDKTKPFGFIGFGGGRHACIGSNFAYLQIKSVWSVFLRNFDFELVDAFPEPDYESMVIGPKPCRVKFTRRKLI
ncbi:MAG: hypothetical protein WDW38_002458 [Sanguina aurantia]